MNVQVQPGYNSQNAFLETLYTLVNHVKHSGIHTHDILEIVEDPVKLARQCTDKVEEISNFFFDAMKDSLDLRTKVGELVTELKVPLFWTIQVETPEGGRSAI